MLSKATKIQSMIVNRKSDQDNIKLKIPILPLIILLAVITIGTVGFYYMWLPDGGTFVEALYMVMITVTTIGYGEVRQLSLAGQVFTMFIAVFGIASLFYIFTTVMETLVLTQLYNLRGKKRMLKRMSLMENHYILVGYGRVGRIVASELESRGLPYIVIDDDFQKHAKDTDRPDFHGLEGDATDDSVLLKASIHKARALIVTIGNPAVSTFVVLSAREANPKLYIIARGDSEILDSKLYKAGANKVINPYETGGKKLANFAINPNISDFMETNFNAGDQKLRLERFKLPMNCFLVGKTLLELDIRKHTGVTIIAVIKNENAELNPPANYTVNNDDEFVALGTPEQISSLYEYVNKAKVGA